jgi:hypothetical protein
MGRYCVAEGVETAEQFHALRGLGVDAYQGWLFAKAMDPAVFRSMLAGPTLPTPDGETPSPPDGMATQALPTGAKRPEPIDIRDTQRREGGRRSAAPAGERPAADSPEGGRRAAGPGAERSEGGRRRAASPAGERSEGRRRADERSEGGRRAAPPVDERSEGGRRAAPPVGESPDSGRRSNAPGAERPEGGRRAASPASERPEGGRRSAPPPSERPDDGRRAAPPAGERRGLSRRPGAPGGESGRRRQGPTHAEAPETRSNPLGPPPRATPAQSPDPLGGGPDRPAQPPRENGFRFGHGADPLAP